MKTEAEVNNARSVLIKNLKQPGLSQDQQAVLRGMLTALVWCADGGSTQTMDDLLAGRPIVPTGARLTITH